MGVGGGGVCVYLVVFLLRVHVCGSVCALASLSHMCGACAVSAGLGEEEEELGDSRAQRRDSDRQAGSRRAACQGAWAPTLGLLQLGGVFGPGLHMPLCSTMCSHPPMQAWSPLSPQLLSFPTPRPLSSLSACGSPLSLTSIHPLWHQSIRLLHIG